MSKKIIGKCSQCGGVVSVETAYLSTVPPVPQCESCGAVADQTAKLPVIPTLPVRPEIPKVRDGKFRGRPSLNELVGKITEDNLHPAVEFGPPVGKEII